MMPPARNPFQQPHPAASAQDLRAVAERPERIERVDKPWGHEEIFAVLEGSYVGKVLHVVAGGRLSLQRHDDKDETVAVQSGRITVEHGSDPGRLERTVLRSGERLLIRARTVHRISAEVDSVVLEASTARPGWRVDIVRIEDNYGRGGTSAP